MNDFVKPVFVKVLLLNFFFSFSSLAQDSSLTDKIIYHQKKVKTYLDKENKLNPYYSIDATGIKIFSSAHVTEFFISWENIPFFTKYIKECSTEQALQAYKSGRFETPRSCVSDKPDTIAIYKSGLFKGYKIAIDPGHTAGDMATGVIERKFLKFQPTADSTLRDSIQLAEGMLTYATATLLKKKLEAEGAEVFMTRKFNGSTAYGITFNDWLKKNYKNAILTPANKAEKFRLVFKDKELQKRAEIINEFKPDFTVIIHYNVDETNTGWKKPGTKNFSMAFIGGAFMPHDLTTIEKRFEFLRMLITTDIEESVRLSSAVVCSLDTALHVKPAGTMDATYLYKGCLYTGKPGVFCRNLQLTRYIHGPLVYGETLYQDNIAECIMLNQETDKLKNIRVNQAADAYYKGIKGYVEAKKVKTEMK